MEKKTETKDKQVQVRYTPSEYMALKRQADEECRSVSNLLHKISTNYLQSQK